MRSIIAEFLEFMKVNRKLWMAPIILGLLLFSLLLIATEGSGVDPFIYAIF